MTILECAANVLQAAVPEEKVQAAHEAFALSRQGRDTGDICRQHAPDTPGRPEKPVLVSPRHLPSRGTGTRAGRIALFHAVAHIELNAVDLAFDMAARFTKDIAGAGLDAHAFVSDWVRVGNDESRHFTMVAGYLAETGTAYGDLPAHGGLWEAATDTAGNIMARLAVAPLVLEARGLDVTPGMISGLRQAEDTKGAGILETIYREEISHVACGLRWFNRICTAEDRDPAIEFANLRKRYFKDRITPPFNHEARSMAGLPRTFYDP